jgi:hypothetical protein
MHEQQQAQRERRCLHALHHQLVVRAGLLMGHVHPCSTVHRVDAPCMWPLLTHSQCCPPIFAAGAAVQQEQQRQHQQQQGLAARQLSPPLQQQQAKGGGRRAAAPWTPRV